MPSSLDLSSLLAGIQNPVRRSVFLSYHHSGDQQYYDALTRFLHDTYEIIYDNSLDRIIDSEDASYVLQRIRENFVKGSSCTIVLCGADTPWRKYVDWEIKATLDMMHGLLGVNLPTNRRNENGHSIVPDRLHDNIQSGYAVWTDWTTFESSAITAKSLVEQAILKPSALIRNGRKMISRNGTPP